MVNYSAAALDATFGALADGTRRALLARLTKGEATVTELAAPFEVSLPAISKHLRVLEAAGLMSRRIEGREHHCRLAAQPLRQAGDWIAQYRIFWEGQLDRLAAHLAKEASTWPHQLRPQKPRSKIGRAHV